MKLIKRIPIRVYQKTMFYLQCLYPIRVPKMIEGEKPNILLSKTLLDKKINNILIITGKNINQLGLPENLLSELKKHQINYSLYLTKPEPSIENVEEALIEYKNKNCQAIVAFGGGSPIDTAKAVAARVVRPNKTIPQLKGTFKVTKRIPTLVAIPTTSGSGSEATCAALICNHQTKEKVPILDFNLIPNYVMLDSNLTVKLSPDVTSITGFDALCHAIESYIGRANTTFTKRKAKEAIVLIWNNLKKAYENGTDLIARKNMQIASYFAGIAFTRAYVGYTHSIAHAIGAQYDISHGRAISIVLPYVLNSYGKSIHQPLSSIAKTLGIKGITNEELANNFISEIIDLERFMKIPEKIDCLKKEDIPELVMKAYSESVPLYPTPRLFDKDEFTKVFNYLLP